MVKAIFPGSFDPPTCGHYDIAKRAAKYFETLYVGVGCNSNKHSPLFTIRERLEMLELIFSEIQNIKIVSFNGLLVDFMQLDSIDVIVRAIRTSGDSEHEIPLAGLNYRRDVETFLLVASHEYRDVSSTLVQEIARGGGSLHGLVPKPIDEIICTQILEMSKVD